MSDRELLHRRICALKFSSWELHLFLDSHPYNCDAAKKLDECRKMLEKLTKEYEEKYGPLAETSDTSSRWQWVSSPWPWELEDDK